MLRVVFCIKCFKDVANYDKSHCDMTNVIFTYHYFDIFDKGVDACIALDKNADA
jgi:hypothetical protein